MRNIRLTLAYDGTAYVGWQIQPNGPSVQSAVTQAIRQLTGSAATLLAAGRTDSGVHALGQVANFRTDSSIPTVKLQAGLQNFLPADIVVRAVDEVADDFHATYSARKKRYRYVIHNSRVSDPLTRRYAWRIAQPLDGEAMQAAAQRLLGQHDFRCFESQFPNKATSVRTITLATVGRHAGWSIWSDADVAVQASNEDGDYVWFDVVADGFLYNMVRAIVGTLVKVGRGDWTADDVRRIIENRDRGQAGETAPPHGLYLVHVEYGPPGSESTAASSTPA